MKRDYILNDSTRFFFGYVMFYIQTLCDFCMMDFMIYYIFILIDVRSLT